MNLVLIEFKNIWVLITSGFLPKEKRDLKNSIVLGVKLFGILILLKAFCFGITYLFDYYEIFKIPKHITLEKIRNDHPITKILMTAVIGPIIEEFTYRSGLLFTKRNLAITITGIFYFTSKYY